MSVFSSLRQLVKVREMGQAQKNLLMFLPSRNTRSETKVKWIRPSKVPSYLPIKSGDQSHFKMPDPKSFRKYYDNNEKLQNCSIEEVRKIFSMRCQSKFVNQKAYAESVTDSVKAHEYDQKSAEVKIAALTAKIRLNQYLWSLKPSKRKIRCVMNELIMKRKKKLMDLRKYDYRKFEWLLQKLDLVFKPTPTVCEVVTRKKSVRLLAELNMKKMQELKLAEFKKKLDEMKVPYLEKKLEKLLWMKNEETKLKLPPTVSESDIEACAKEIEAVKMEVEKRSKKGYVRKVHPYTLEIYEPKQQNTAGNIN